MTGGGMIVFLQHSPAFGGDQTPRKKHWNRNRGSRGPAKRKIV